MVLENLHCLRDEVHRFERGDWLSLQEKIGNTIEIRERPPGVNQARQDLALGFGADLLCARARMYV